MLVAHRLMTEDGNVAVGLEGVFPETRLPVYGILGNSISTTTHARKPYI
jgi:hypothetical protein